MSANPIRVATSALGLRIYAGRPTKDGLGFKEPRYDVTSDVLAAIRDKVGVGNEIDVASDAGVEFRIQVLPPRPAPVDQSPEDLRWNIVSNLRWLAEQPNRPGYMPCGELTGAFLLKVADKFQEVADGDPANPLISGVSNHG